MYTTAMSPIDATTLLLSVTVATVVFGGLITVRAYQAYRRTASPSLRALAAGIALLTAGALVAGVAHQVTGLTLAESVAVQSTVSAAGFGFLLHALAPLDPGR
jgi:hypothetical protein